MSIQSRFDEEWIKYCYGDIVVRRKSRHKDTITKDSNQREEWKIRYYQGKK